MAWQILCSLYLYIFSVGCDGLLMSLSVEDKCLLYISHQSPLTIDYPHPAPPLPLCKTFGSTEAVKSLFSLEFSEALITKLMLGREKREDQHPAWLCWGVRQAGLYVVFLVFVVFVVRSYLSPGGASYHL